MFLILDGIAALRADLESMEETFTSIVSQGLSYGVHVDRHRHPLGRGPPAIKDLLGTRIELRLGDPIDSNWAAGLRHWFRRTGPVAASHPANCTC